VARRSLHAGCVILDMPNDSRPFFFSVRESRPPHRLLERPQCPARYNETSALRDFSARATRSNVFSVYVIVKEARMSLVRISEKLLLPSKPSPGGIPAVQVGGFIHGRHQYNHPNGEEPRSNQVSLPKSAHRRRWPRLPSLSLFTSPSITESVWRAFQKAVAECARTWTYMARCGSGTPFVETYAIGDVLDRTDEPRGNIPRSGKDSVSTSLWPNSDCPAAGSHGHRQGFFLRSPDAPRPVCRLRSRHWRNLARSSTRYRFQWRSGEDGDVDR